MPETNLPNLNPALVRAAELLGDLDDVGIREGADSGEPWIRSRELFAGERLRFGVWESTPGGWDIENRPGTESMFILSGRIRLTPTDQPTVELTAGDSYVLEFGWTGRWETLETVRKIYSVAGI